MLINVVFKSLQFFCLFTAAVWYGKRTRGVRDVRCRKHLFEILHTDGDQNFQNDPKHLKLGLFVQS